VAVTQQETRMLANAAIVPYIPAADIPRARKFYEDVVGLKAQEVYAGGVIYECGKGSWVFMYPRGTGPGTRPRRSTSSFPRRTNTVVESTVGPLPR